MAQALLAAPQTGAADRVEGEAAARRALRAQVGRLERELSALAVSAFPREVVVAVPAARAGCPRLLSFGELEALRDRLSARVADARSALAERTAREEEARALLEQMLLEPGRHRFVKVANADRGVGGCGVWHVRPRLGLIGMLMGWWQVKLSSGCPLSPA
ncbi:hypothetical protein [Capillimicrobium parvum]|uniref:Uncharacterized protein n=1 Tax=Capillimicrobium parvum TaxID=2884022 RepID=A0A9E6Y135_9ACTN|nr:hypothetical protein [Capillimicrobium parvum]UGS37990.1 hypothetical protein DSM104329_04412 [Capillimicrobium parvum]